MAAIEWADFDVGSSFEDYELASQLRDDYYISKTGSYPESQLQESDVRLWLDENGMGSPLQTPMNYDMKPLQLERHENASDTFCFFGDPLHSQEDMNAKAIENCTAKQVTVKRTEYPRYNVHDGVKKTLTMSGKWI